MQVRGGQRDYNLKGPTITSAALIVALFPCVGTIICCTTFSSDKRKSSDEPKLLIETQAMSKETKPRWKNVDVQGKVTLYIPPRMRPSNVIGDSLAYREAFKNEYLEIIIVYGDADSCAVPN